MLTTLPGNAKPRTRHFYPVARIVPDPLRGLDPWERQARALAERQKRIRCAIESPAWGRCFYTNRADFTALASFTSEASLLAGNNDQPTIPAGHFSGVNGYGRMISIRAWGVLSVTGTPTYTFQTRLSSTAGSSTLSGASVGVSAALTAGSGVTNQIWKLELDLICNTPGQGTGNTTLCCAGSIWSPGLAAPYTYPLEVTTPDTATWTQTFDSTLTYFFNLSVTCSASSASNTIRCKQLQAYSSN